MMRMRVVVVLGLVAVAGAGCVTAAMDAAITKDMGKKDPTACTGGLTWRRSVKAPLDCIQSGDSRELCQERCYAAGE